MMNPIEASAPAFMPSTDIPISICAGLEASDIDSKISGMMTYEVVSKDEYGIEIKIKSITLNAPKRII